MARHRPAGLALLVVLACAGRAFGVGLNDAIELIRLGQQAVTEVMESWDMIAQRLPADKLPGENLVLMKMMERELLKQMNHISKQIDEHQDRMENKADMILTQLLQQLPMQSWLDNSMRELDHYVGQVLELYKLFEMYSNNPDKYEKYTIVQFAKTCVSPRLGELPDVLKSMHRLMVPSEQQVYNRSILVVLANQMQEASNQMCNEMQSSQQLLYNLYNAVALTEIKGYTMIQFSYMLLRLFEEGINFNEEIQTLKHQYAIRTSETLRAVKTAMAFAPRSLWRCDPNVHKLDETYTELKQLFQGFIVNEVDLNTHATCKENCVYYGYSKMYGCYQNQFCAKQRQCNGKILNCEYIDSDMWICPSDRNSSRRYDYIDYENGLHYGNAKSCSRDTFKVDSWWRWLFWHCSYCFCYCDDQNSSSERYFSLRSVVSDYSHNKVITGVRLKKINRVIHIQIQEGQLLPRGAINASTIEWQSVDAFSIMDPHIVNGIDYHTIVWEKRALDLDNLLSLQDHLLTGIRFRMVGSRLNLEIMISPFNFTSGLLIQPKEKSFWHSNDVTSRTELAYTEPDIPIRNSLLNVPDSGENQYLNFAPSDRRKDAAQSTIPFIDVQPVTPNPPVPLSGAGIFHKGRKGSGGFVALKLTTYDFAPHLQIDLPPAPPVLETPNEIKAS
ncbi:chemokine-like protein orion isoform X1 [Temnothorax americanus]|uniref:chemokine-like protein orion isoform X1 n=1 Tax=Temnothorax americanus TaxID=1964332 RepID=UPI0040686EAC